MNAEDLAKYAARAAPSSAEQDAEAQAEADRPVPFPFSENEDIPLPVDYVPTKHDVINGRGRKSYNHIANRRFRQLIGMNLDRYLAARCKVDKTLVVVGIVNTIRNGDPVGGFLKKCPKRGRWISMSDETAREKVGHCLRDMIAAQRGEHMKQAAKGSGPKRMEPPTSDSPGAEIAEKPLSHYPWLSEKIGPDRLSLTSSRAPFAKMWDVVRNQITPANDKQDSRPNKVLSSSVPPLSLSRPMNRAPDPPPMREYNDGSPELQEYGSIQGQDMSDQQRKILIKLEGGFKGSIEELIEAVK